MPTYFSETLSTEPKTVQSQVFAFCSGNASLAGPEEMPQKRRTLYVSQTSSLHFISMKYLIKLHSFRNSQVYNKHTGQMVNTQLKIYLIFSFVVRLKVRSISVGWTAPKSGQFHFRIVTDIFVFPLSFHSSI